jgi:DNA-binding transcriptional LysR family regulator
MPGIRTGGKSLALEGPKGVVKVAVQGRVASNDFFLLREAIAAGIGIGPLPWFLASPELAAGRITRVLPEYRAAGGTAYLVYPPAKPLPAKLVKFCAHLMAHVPMLAAPG